MCSWIKRLAAPVAALFLIGFMPSAVNAATITFSTTGKFTNPGTGTFPNTTSLSGDDLKVNSAATIHFNGSAFTFDIADDGSLTPIGFGYFSSSGGTVGSFTGAQFELSIDQTAPLSAANPDGLFHATGTGSVSFNANTGGLHLTFSAPLSFSVPSNPSIKYTINELQDLAFSPSFGVQGNAGVLPLPGVAVGGLWLLGGLGSVGGLNALRRRFGFAVAGILNPQARA